MITKILHQPFNSDGTSTSLGIELINELNSGNYREVLIISAFATSSGTSRIYGGLLNIPSRNIRILLGIANGVTSIQAVQQLNRLRVRVKGVDTGPSILFHPKIYLLKGPRKVWISIGSSNLTREGLFRNFETNAILILDPREEIDRLIIRNILDFVEFIEQSYTNNITELSTANLLRLVRNGILINENITPVTTQRRRTQRPRGIGTPARIIIPAAPPPHPDLIITRGRIPRRIPSLPLISRYRFFAMTLSSFDSSHRSDVPGTPEIDIPESVVSFFPEVSLRGHRYPDAFFDVLLNTATRAEEVQYRIWHRPPGTPAGHPDWRINVKHKTIDQTTLGGGDIILFEKLPAGSNQAYEVWIMPRNDPNYNRIRSNCTRTAGRGTRPKYYGLF